MVMVGLVMRAILMVKKPVRLSCAIYKKPPLWNTSHKGGSIKASINYRWAIVTSPQKEDYCLTGIGEPGYLPGK
jgi:hypothetical protein